VSLLLIEISAENMLTHTNPPDDFQLLLTLRGLAHAWKMQAEKKEVCKPWRLPQQLAKE
jgi:hypothetical protein